MTYLPAVISAEYVTEYIVKLEFDDGTIKSVDVSQWFIGPVFESLKEPASFRKFLWTQALLPGQQALIFRQKLYTKLKTFR